MISSGAVVQLIRSALQQLVATPVAPNGRKILFLGQIDAAPLPSPVQEALARMIQTSGAALVATHGEYATFGALRSCLSAEINGPHFHAGQPVRELLRMLHRKGDAIIVVEGPKRAASVPVAPPKPQPEEEEDLLEESALFGGGRPVFTSAANLEITRSLCQHRANDYSGSPYLKPGKPGRSLPHRMLRAEAQKRGHPVWIDRSDGRSVVMVDLKEKRCVAFNLAPDISTVCVAITSNKEVTKRLLARHGIPVPQGGVFTELSEAEKCFTERSSPQVVKPLAGARSRGVTVNVSNREDLVQAWNRARPYGRAIIVEDYFVGDLVRIMVLGGQVKSALCRTPAYVIGDGVCSIAALIERKNLARLNNPTAWNHPILTDKLEQLQRDGRSLEEIPPAGQYVRLTSEPMVSTGGEIVNIIEHLHPSLLAMASRIARLIPGSTLIGMDLLVTDFTVGATPENVCLLEVNSSPVMPTSVFPSAGPPVVDFVSQMFDWIEKGEYATAERTTDGTPAIRPARIVERAEDPEASVQTLLIQAARARRMQIEEITDQIVIFEQGGQRCGFATGAPSCTRTVSRRACRHRGWSRQRLQRFGIAIPVGDFFPVQEQDRAWKYAQSLGRPVAIRPMVGTQGLGVAVRESSKRTSFMRAWKRVEEGGAETILVEEQGVGHRYRVVVIGEAIRAVTWRGALQGDAEERREDATESVHPGFVELAVRVRRAMYDPLHVGIDWIAEDIARSPEDQRWAVVGVYVNPGLNLHHCPTRGPARGVAGALLEELFGGVSGIGP